MPSPSGSPPRGRIALIAGVIAIAALFAIPPLLTPLLGAMLHARARARGVEARWQRLSFAWPLHVEIAGLTLQRDAESAPFATVRHARAALAPRLWSLAPHVTRLEIEGAQVRLRSGADDEDSTAVDEQEPTGA